MSQPKPIAVVINEVVLSGLGLAGGVYVLEKAFVAEEDHFIAAGVHNCLFAELLEVELLSLMAWRVSGYGFLAEPQMGIWDVAIWAAKIVCFLLVKKCLDCIAFMKNLR